MSQPMMTMGIRPMTVAKRERTAIDLLMEKGCVKVIVCEGKPIHYRDVTP
jgi:hypothetical protein